MKQIMSTVQTLFESDVIQGPWGTSSSTKSSPTPNVPIDQMWQGYGRMIDRHGNPVTGPKDMSQMKPVSMRDAFGGDEYNAIIDMGYNFCEKPAYFADLDNEYTIPMANIAAINRTIGRKLNTYYLEKILTPRKSRTRNGIVDEYGPLADANFDLLQSPDEETIILVARNDDDVEGDYETGDMFLANRTGASKYFRMWAKLV